MFFTAPTGIDQRINFRPSIKYGHVVNSSNGPLTRAPLMAHSVTNGPVRPSVMTDQYRSYGGISSSSSSPHHHQPPLVAAHNVLPHNTSYRGQGAPHLISKIGGAVISTRTAPGFSNGPPFSSHSGSIANAVSNNKYTTDFPSLGKSYQAGKTVTTTTAAASYSKPQAIPASANVVTAPTFSAVAASPKAILSPTQSVFRAMVTSPPSDSSHANTMLNVRAPEFVRLSSNPVAGFDVPPNETSGGGSKVGKTADGFLSKNTSGGMNYGAASGGNRTSVTATVPASAKIKLGSGSDLAVATSNSTISLMSLTGSGIAIPTGATVNSKGGTSFSAGFTGSTILTASAGPTASATVVTTQGEVYIDTVLYAYVHV